MGKQLVFEEFTKSSNDSEDICFGVIFWDKQTLDLISRKRHDLCFG